MSADKQNIPSDPMLLLEVVPLKLAWDLVQGAESRGDFRFKGIKTVFQFILDWTQKYDTNGVLASRDQLMRECNLDPDRIKEYLTELLGRGHIDQQLVTCFPALQYIAGSDAHIDAMQVFCRPPEKEGTQTQRYHQGYVERNFQALSRWIDTRQVPKLEKVRDWLNKSIQNGRLRDTRARAELARLFQSDLDVTPQQKRDSNILFVRPVLKKLLDARKLVLLQGRTPDGQDFNGVFFNKSDELDLRFRVLAEYFANHIAHTGGKEVDPVEVAEQLKSFDGGRYQGLNEGQKQVIQELILLAPTLQKQQKEKAEEARKADLGKTLEELLKFKHVVEAGSLKDRSPEEIDALRSVKDVLHAQYAVRGRIGNFLLHKDNIGDAIQFARDKFDKTEDDTDVRILTAMGLERYLDKDRYKSFLDLEQRTLFQQLPLLTRLWRLLTGSRKLSQKEVVQMKTKVQKEQEREMVKVRTGEARKAQKELVSRRMKKQDGADEAAEGGATDDEANHKANKKDADGGGFEAPEPESVEDMKKREAEIEEARDLLKKIVETLDKAWEQGLFPNRTHLLEGMSAFEDENQLVMFLKKYGRKEVLSFRIKHDKPQYVWPILISRRYVKRKGKALYSKYSELADKQRQASMPDQHKFDVATSVEDFLGRIL
ncbi:MAG: hypothetical protein KDK30_12450, partial [Leptospiraceae bacterium]|nr:hypothetical protein [Leptospiraceae bacterium]